MSATSEYESAARNPSEVLDQLQIALARIAELEALIETVKPEVEMPVTQLDLISVISTYIAKHLKYAPPLRVLTAIITGAMEIVRELEEPYRQVVPGMGLEAWLRSDATGLSSRFLAATLTGAGAMAEFAHPHDAADFGRCLGLLVACPELRARLPKMRSHGEQWTAFVDHWDELEALHEADLVSGTAPKLGARIREVLS